MTNQNQFITVQEACLYSSKAEKTIRNLIKKVLVKNPDNTFTSKDSKKVLVKKEGKRFFYLVNKNFLDENFNKKNKEVGEPEENIANRTTSNENKTTGKDTSKNKQSTSNQKYIDLVISQQKDEIENLREQNRAKDQQIANYQERDREHNILIKEYQQLTLPKRTTKEEQGSDKTHIVDVEDKNITPEEVKAEEPAVEKKQSKTKNQQKEEGIDKPKKGFWSGLFS